MLIGTLNAATHSPFYNSLKSNEKFNNVLINFGKNLKGNNYTISVNDSIVEYGNDEEIRDIVLYIEDELNRFITDRPLKYCIKVDKTKFY